MKFSLDNIFQRYIILNNNYFKIGLQISLLVLIRFIYVVIYDLDYSSVYFISYFLFPLLLDQFFGAVALTLNKILARVYLFVFSTYLFTSNVIFIYHIKVYGKPPGVGAIAAMFETTPQEAVEFTRIVSYGELAFILLIAASAFIGLYRFKKNTITKNISKKTVWLALLIILGSHVVINNLEHKVKMFSHGSYIMQDIKNVAYYVREYTKLSKLKTNFKVENFFPVQNDSITNKKQVHVLVIGESLSRNHMEIYGYKRATTPFLSNNKNLNVFKNVISPTTQTRSSLARMLTTSFGLSIKNNGSIINLLNELNFKTYWLSNQTRYGISDTETSIIADYSDEVKYVNNDWKSNSLDEKILPELDKLLLDTASKKFVIIHLMGSHFEYSKRYTSEFEINDDYNYYPHNNNLQKQRIDEYDASVKYTDNIVSQVVERLRDKDVYSTLVFVSDHGEDVYENKKNLLGHGSPYVTKYTVEVPFIVWQSDKFKQQRGLAITENHLNQFYNNGNLFYSLTDLYNVDFKQNDTLRSIFKLVDEKEKYPYVINSNNKKINYFDLEK